MSELVHRDNLHSTLDLVSQHQLIDESLRRYEGDPNVHGDDTAQHIARVGKLAAYVMPYILIEFPDTQNLEAEIYRQIILHETDETVKNVEIAAAKEYHNQYTSTQVSDSISGIRNALKSLTKEQVDYVIEAVEPFKKREGLPALIVKVLDRVAGSMLVCEQGIGVIHPDSILFSKEYLLAFKGKSGSSIMDNLIDAMVERLIERRNNIKNNKAEIEELAMGLSTQCSKSKSELIETMERLLQIDLNMHNYLRERVLTPIWEYPI